MATDPIETLPAEPGVDSLPAAPLSGTRRQAMQRLQVGLFGLGAMILLVALANVINANREQNEALVVPESAPTASARAGEQAASDPLADAGVVPDPAVRAEASSSPPPPETGDAPRVQP